MVSGKPSNLRWRLTMGLLAAAAVALCGYGLIRDDVAPLEPLPSDVPVKYAGALRVGDFAFEHRAIRFSQPFAYHGGETVSLAYQVSGFRLDSSGRADVQSSTAFASSDADTAPIGTGARFHEPIKSSGRIRFTCRFDLNENAQPGDYRIVIRLHDNVLGADLEFRPLVRITPAN